MRRWHQWWPNKYWGLKVCIIERKILYSFRFFVCEANWQQLKRRTSRPVKVLCGTGVRENLVEEQRTLQGNNRIRGFYTVCTQVMILKEWEDKGKGFLSFKRRCIIGRLTYRKIMTSKVQVPGWIFCVGHLWPLVFLWEEGFGNTSQGNLWSVLRQI